MPSSSWPRAAALERRVSLSPDTTIEQDPDGPAVAVNRWVDVALDGLAPAVLEGLRRMLLGPVAWENLPRPAGATHQAGPLITDALDRLRGSVVHHLARDDDGSVLLSATPVVPEAFFHPIAVGADDVVRLSRFAALRPAASTVVMSSPVADYAVTFDDPTLAGLVARVAAPTAVTDIEASDAGDARTVLGFLVAAGLVLVRQDGVFAEDADDTLSRWSAHELDFYHHSRMTDVADVNAPIEPMAAPAGDGPAVRLYRPSRHDTAVDDVALTHLLETDCVCPSFSGLALPATRLGELLFRAARVRSTEPWPVSRAAAVEASQRPYLSVTLLFELEIYVVADHVGGIVRGLHRYEPVSHRLLLVDDDDEHLADILDTAALAAAQRRRPAAVFVITARRGRSDWVFGDASHAMSLVHAGALLQVLRLCAQAMGLSLHPVPPQPLSGLPRGTARARPREAVVGQCVVDVPG